ncbi:MAG: Fic family protein [Bacteroidales bacterium]|nr:Fic family protein [Bacteroidales bacterium]
MDNFDEYIKQSEPHKREKGTIWQTAIGLQAVDGLKPSQYLIDTARQNIEGDITFDEVKSLIDTYYTSKTDRNVDTDRTEEADKVSARIAELLSEKTFSLSPADFLFIHKRLFDGLYQYAGRIRTYNITKKEWVLRGATVLYASADTICENIHDIFLNEKNFDYSNLSISQIINHLSKFISSIWQIHPFGEGNTRTTAVFTIKYLRKLGFDVSNNMFADNSWYFRNALVRANYSNIKNNIVETIEPLEKFFRNLLLNENNLLKNRYLIIGEDLASQLVGHSPDKLPDKSPDKLPDKLKDEIPFFVEKLVKSIQLNCLSVKEMLTLLNLRDRENFLNLYLNPAIKGGFVVALFPDKPRHPRQKYFLTDKGKSLLNSL